MPTQFVGSNPTTPRTPRNPITPRTPRINNNNTNHFDGVGKQLGLEIWRVEKNAPKRIHVGEHGNFFSGNSYIVLKTEELPHNNKKEHHVHFWCGNEKSIHEFKTAEHRVTELCDLLGHPVKYTETQGSEGERFLSYFTESGGLKYLKGEMDTVLRQTEEVKYPVRLLQIKGKKNARVVQVEVSHTSLNHGDTFILDNGMTIYQWNGKLSNKMEKTKALVVRSRIRSDERSAKAVEIQLEDGDGDDQCVEFWALLGVEGKQFALIKSAEDGGDDQEFENKLEYALYKIVDVGNRGEAMFATNKPTQASLNSKFCYVLDCENELFTWVGKQATRYQRSYVMEYAKELLTSKNRPQWTPIERISDGAETAMFKSKFPRWTAVDIIIKDYSKTLVSNVASVQVQKAADISRMLINPRLIKEALIENSKLDVVTQAIEKDKLKQVKKQQLAQAASNGEIMLGAVIAEMEEEENEADDQHYKMYDEATGTVKIWRIEKFNQIEIPLEDYGRFYDSDCYIIAYTYGEGTGKQHVIYFWQGKNTNKDEKGTSALLSQAVNKQHCGNCAKLIRVVQGKETLHFMRLFKDRFLTLKGRHALHTNRLAAQNELYHLRGHKEFAVKIISVKCKCEMLNSSDVFVLVTTTNKIYIWIGKGANEYEKSTAKQVANNILSRDKHNGKSDIIEVNEGCETEEFWSQFEGGKTEYGNMPILQKVNYGEHDARLFHCSNTSGVFKVTEVQRYMQEDLDDEDVMILDTLGNQIFVWIGTKCNNVEKNLTIETAKKYLANLTDGRTSTANIIEIQPGQEPMAFKTHFVDWESNQTQATFIDPYQLKLRKQKEAASQEAEANQANNAPARTRFGTVVKNRMADLRPVQRKEPEKLDNPEEQSPSNNSSVKGVSKLVGAWGNPNQLNNSQATTTTTTPTTTTQSVKFAPTVQFHGGSESPFPQEITEFYSYDALKNEVGKIFPSYIDTSRKEAYLCDEDFLKIFQVTKEEFAKMPKWKQLIKKKDTNLF